MRFNKHETDLFVANTANDTIVRVPVESGGIAGDPVVFTNSINGADGLLIDDDDNLWVAANQADEIVVVDPDGRAIAKLGDFDGVTEDGLPIHLLFPASIRFSGRDLLVTNLALNTNLFGFLTVDTAWSAQVSRYTVSRIRANIPALRSDVDDGEDDDYAWARSSLRPEEVHRHVVVAKKNSFAAVGHRYRDDGVHASAFAFPLNVAGPPPGCLGRPGDGTGCGSEIVVEEILMRGVDPAGSRSTPNQGGTPL